MYFFKTRAQFSLQVTNIFFQSLNYVFTTARLCFHRLIFQLYAALEYCNKSLATSVAKRHLCEQRTWCRCVEQICTKASCKTCSDFSSPGGAQFCNTFCVCLCMKSTCRTCIDFSSPGGALFSIFNLFYTLLI